MKILLLLILIFGISCSNQERQVNWNPFYPNEGITVKQLTSNGFELGNVEHSMCVFSKFQINKSLHFYTNQVDDCEDVFGQELIIELNIPTTANIYEHFITDTLINRIDSIFLIYNSKRIGNLELKSQCRYEIEAINKDQIKLTWSLTSCDEQLKLIITSDIQQKNAP